MSATRRRKCRRCSERVKRDSAFSERRAVLGRHGSSSTVGFTTRRTSMRNGSSGACGAELAPSPRFERGLPRPKRGVLPLDEEGMALPDGFEPPTFRFEADCSCSAELRERGTSERNRTSVSGFGSRGPTIGRHSHWSARLDWNQRPPASKAGTLPYCATG